MDDDTGTGSTVREQTAMPTAMMRDVPTARVADVEAWWALLDQEARRLVHAMTDERLDDMTLSFVNEDGAWRPLPIELRARFVDPEDARDDALAVRELIEFINAHEEVGFYLQERRFHICRAHPAARRVVETGVIPADFACPLGQARCPHEEAARLADGHALRLGVVLRIPKRRPTCAGMPPAQ